MHILYNKYTYIYKQQNPYSSDFMDIENNISDEQLKALILRKFPHGEKVWQLNIDKIAEIKELILKYYPIE